MKKYFLFLFLWSISCFQSAQLVSQEETLQIYLCSRLTQAAKQWNDEVSKELNSEFSLFRPQDIDLSNVVEDHQDQAAYQADIQGMTQSHLLLVLPPYGRDCSWEIGWFCGKERPAIAYVETEDDWIRDVMVKGGLTAIITNNSKLFKILLADPITAKKTYFISSKQDLAKIIKQIHSFKLNERSE